MKTLAPLGQYYAAGLASPSDEPSSLLDCQTAFRRIATNCLHLIQTSRTSAMAGEPRAIHKMRIELTRLRAIVLFFFPMTKDVARLRLKKELRWLNAALGEARDHDVTMIYVRRKRYRNWAKPVSRALARATGKSHRSLAKTLDSNRYEGLIVALRRWITAGPWLSSSLSFRSERVEVFSKTRLRDWRTAISRKGRKLGALRRQQLHRLRIRAKRYRYVVDALQALGVNVTQEDLAFCEIAKQMHAALGDLRDLKRLRRAGHGRPPGYRKGRKQLLKRAERPFRRLPRCLTRLRQTLNQRTGVA